MAQLQQRSAEPSQLSRHAIKKICESSDAQKEFLGEQLAVQLTDVTIFGPEDNKKNVRGRATLSDGVSKMIAMIPEKVHNAMIASNYQPRKFDVWLLTGGKFQVQAVQNKRVLVLKGAPEASGKNVQDVIGAPQDYARNKEQGSFSDSYDLRIPGAQASEQNLAEDDIAGALDDFKISSASKDQPRGYERSEMVARGAESVPNVPDEAYMPIKALNQFTSDFTIKARIVKKGALRTYKNQRGEGKLLNVDLIDRDGTLIQGTFFGECAAKFADSLQEEGVYTFQNATVKLANKRYTSIKNDYCLTFDHNTEVGTCANDATIVGDGFSFTGLAGLEELYQNHTVDVVGVILEVGMTGRINLKDGSMKDKRTLTIGDESNVSIMVTLWGDACGLHDYQTGQVIALRQCRVSEYNGRSLNASSDPGDIKLNCRHKRVAELRHWQGENTASKLKSDMRSLGNQNPDGQRKKTPVMLIEELTRFASEDSDVLDGKPLYCQLNVDLTWIFVPETPDRQMFYLACSQCKRKVIDDGTGYRCEHCQRSYEDAVPTYNFTVRISDCTGSMTMNCLGDVGESIMGMKGAEFHEMHQDIAKVKAHTSSLLFKPISVVVRAKRDNSGYSQEESGPAIRYSAVRLQEHSYSEQSQSILERLALFAKMPAQAEMAF